MPEGEDMPTWFNDVVKQADSGEKAAIRAVQAWQHLIGKAANRQIVRYEELRDLMDYPTCNPLASILGCIMGYCEQHGLPPLTLLVVNKAGVPGAGFTAEEPGAYHRRREEVFTFPWLKLMAPAIDELRQASLHASAKVKN